MLLKRLFANALSSNDVSVMLANNLMESFSKDPEVVIGIRRDDNRRCLSPRAVRISQNVHRLFFMEHGPTTPVGMQGVICSATSADGDIWTKDQGVFPGAENRFNFDRFLSPDVIRSDNGNWLMHFEGRRANGNAVIAVALSSDCLEWSVRSSLSFQGINPADSIGSPSIVKVNDEMWRMYFHLRRDRIQIIRSATSPDCLNWKIEEGVRISQSLATESYAAYAPHVVRFEDGNWIMVYSGWSRSPIKTGRILWAVSKDGLNWDKAKTPLLSPDCFEDARHCSEPSLLRLDDGRWKLFYEGCGKDGVWRILGATTSNTKTQIH
jgi:sucrose-6-phosphate hydrolase SacC (GH32 family)